MSFGMRQQTETGGGLVYLRKRYGLAPSQLMIVGILLKVQGKEGSETEGQIFPSIARLERETGLHHDTVRGALKTLVKKGVVRREMRARSNSQKSYHYDLLEPIWEAHEHSVAVLAKQRNWADVGEGESITPPRVNLSPPQGESITPPRVNLSPPEVEVEVEVEIKKKYRIDGSCAAPFSESGEAEEGETPTATAPEPEPFEKWIDRIDRTGLREVPGQLEMALKQYGMHVPDDLPFKRLEAIAFLQVAIDNHQTAMAAD